MPPSAPRTLLALWRAHPANRALGHLLMPLLGLEVDASRPEAGRFWDEADRRGRDERGDYDLEHGLPLAVTHPSTGLELCWVPPARFHMGGAVFPEESPVHPVELGGFWIGRDPVTVEQYDDFVRHADAPPPLAWEAQLEAPERPVILVTWKQAADYCAWAGLRLPTEAEWELAARGVDGALFPWGDASPSRRTSNFNPGHRRAADWDRWLLPCGATALDLSPFGLRDMGGNVSQWCQDWFGQDYYVHSPVEDPRGPAAGYHRVLRGNSWLSELALGRFRASDRKSLNPVDSTTWVGFRVARDLTG